MSTKDNPRFPRPVAKTAPMELSGHPLPAWASGIRTAPGRQAGCEHDFDDVLQALGKDPQWALAELLTIKDVATILRVSTKTVRRSIDRGQLETVRIGRAIRIRPESVMRLIKGGTR